MRLSRLTDRSRLLPILEQDRLYAAYAIGDLTEPLFRDCEWVVASDDQGHDGLCLLYKGLSVPALFTMGSPQAFVAILEQELRPGRAYFTGRPEHLDAVARFYHLDHVDHLWRMSVAEWSFRPSLMPASPITPDQASLLNRLYHLEGNYFFAPSQLEHGVYYGIWVGQELVAAAGTHIVAPEYGIACVGNVFTHPNFRNRGFATACTSAVVQTLLQKGCSQIVLNVRQKNIPALRAYERIGFQRYCQIAEVGLTRKGSLTAWIERLWRG